MNSWIHSWKTMLQGMAYTVLTVLSNVLFLPWLVNGWRIIIAVIVIISIDKSRFTSYQYNLHQDQYRLDLVWSPCCTPVAFFVYRRWRCHFLYIVVIPILYHGGKGEETARYFYSHLGTYAPIWAGVSKSGSKTPEWRVYHLWTTEERKGEQIVKIMRSKIRFNLEEIYSDSIPTVNVNETVWLTEISFFKRDRQLPINYHHIGMGEQRPLPLMEAMAISASDPMREETGQRRIDTLWSVAVSLKRTRKVLVTFFITSLETFRLFPLSSFW